MPDSVLFRSLPLSMEHELVLAGMLSYLQQNKYFTSCDPIVQPPLNRNGAKVS